MAGTVACACSHHTMCTPPASIRRGAAPATTATRWTRLLDQCETTIRILAQALKQTSIQLRALGDQLNNARTKPTEEAK